jgi:hypothetical protein
VTAARLANAFLDAFLIKEFIISVFNRDSKGKLPHWYPQIDISHRFRLFSAIETNWTRTLNGVRRAASRLLVNLPFLSLFGNLHWPAMVTEVLRNRSGRLSIRQSAAVPNIGESDYAARLDR